MASWCRNTWPLECILYINFKYSMIKNLQCIFLNKYEYTNTNTNDLFYSICYIFILNLLLVNCKKSNRTLCSHQISSRAFCFHHHERSITAIAFSYLLHTFNQLIKTPFLPLICLDNCKKCRYRSRLLPLHTQILVNPN